jgi:uncharacterized membrane protein YuzA (DUF378 family)
LTGAKVFPQLAGIARIVNRLSFRIFDNDMSILVRSNQYPSNLRHSLFSQAPVNRNEFFAGLCIVAFANGVLVRIVEGLTGPDWLAFLFNTLDISVILWAALVAGIFFLVRSPAVPMRSFDVVAGSLVAVACLIPVAPLSWIALAGLAGYLALTSPDHSMARRGGWILATMTVPMFWSRIVFALFSNSILGMDAALVGWLIGTDRTGNAVEFADGSGYLWIAPACSSFANVSIAVLCSVLFAQLKQIGWSVRQMAWAAMACTAVIIINAIRLGLIGMYSEHFDLLHGPIGATTANWLSLAAIVGICTLGIRIHVAANR